MSHEASPAAPEPSGRGQGPGRGRGRGPWRWRLLALMTLVVAGGLFMTSAVDSRAGALRTSGITDLASVVRDQRADTDALQDRVARLDRQVTTLSRGVDDAQNATLQAAVDRQRGPAGMTAVRGPGLTVTLEDAPDDVIDRALADGDPPADTLVVHQQDIQAVVNALWLGGARGVSIMDQRIISTTGIKCAGPTVILHGVPYSPPYVIRAVGDPLRLSAALDSSEYIDAYRVVADRYGLGFAEESSGDLRLPGYEGTTELRYAEPLG